MNGAAHVEVERIKKDLNTWVEGATWFRCDQPERPGDDDCVYAWDCDGCVVGMTADARFQGDQAGWNVYEDGTFERAMTLAESLHECLSERGHA